jgi:uncharacterized SAM-binding protein YcdF (DUF218 family)
VPPAPTARSSPPGAILLPPEQPTRGRGRVLRIAAGVIIALGGVWLISGMIVLPRRDTLRSPAPLVVIALGAGARDDSTLTSASATRLEMAIAYARAHNASIVTTRVHGNRGEVSDRAQRAMISAAGLADRWIALPNQVANTRDEALAMHMVIPDSQPIAVVTSPLHTRRACATFERVGYDVTCIASAQYDWWRLPQAVVYETAAFVKYRMRGWW